MNKNDSRKRNEGENEEKNVVVFVFRFGKRDHE